MKDSKSLAASNDPQLTTSKTQKLDASNTLALDALSEATKNEDDIDQEVAESNQVAETLSSLQNLIERHAEGLSRVKDELKEKRQMLKNFFDNDVQLNEAKEQMENVSNQVKERKGKMESDPQVTGLKVDIKNLNEQKTDIEETLSTYLVNYHQLTNSTSFDTSDGDQWDFKVSARIKSKKGKKEE